MYKGLYDQFAHWFHDGKGAVYFYSDPHFADDEMKYLRADYIGDEEQVKRINSKIGKYDTLVILGDIGDTEWVKKLRGYKVLIMGNHDAGASNYKRAIKEVEHNSDTCPHCGEKVEYDLQTLYYMGDDYAWCPWCRESVKPKRDVYEDNRLFDEVYEGALLISDKILLSHEPIDYSYALNIHGHDHSQWFKSDNTHLNVCAELINYTPIPLKSIIESGALKEIPNIHRDTIDKAIARKLKNN